jgi:hypothetical protein
VLPGQDCVVDGYGSVVVVGSTVVVVGSVVVVGAIVVVGTGRAVGRLFGEKERQRNGSRYSGRLMTISALPLAAASAVLRWRR